MTFLITGARGHIARSLVHQLLKAGHTVRATSSTPEGTDLPIPVDPAGTSLEGVTAAFVYADPARLPGFLTEARRAGVGHLVLLSADPSGYEDPITRLHSGAERLVAESGIPWTFLRPTGFATNALHWATAIRATGVVRTPFPKARSWPIHEADIAAVAVQALTNQQPSATHTLTGPELLTFGEQVAQLGDALGRRLTCDLQPLEDYRAEVRTWSTPEMAEALIRRTSATITRAPAATTAVRDLTGEPARTFATWVKDHLSAFGGYERP